MQADYQLHNIIYYIKWYYSGQTVQQILKLHERNFSNCVVPTEHDVKWWILSFETRGCINATHHHEVDNVSDNDIEKISDNCTEYGFDIETKLDIEMNISQSNWEENNADNDTKEGILQIDLSKIKCENVSFDKNAENTENMVDKVVKNELDISNKEEIPIKNEYSHLPSTSHKTGKKPLYCCSLCNKNVTNFYRHLVQRHSEDSIVQQALALPAGSTERKTALSLLHNRNKQTVICRLDRRKAKVNKCKPCPYCLRYYSFDTIKRHRRRCQYSFGIEASEKTQICHLKIDPILKKTVFPHMRIDYATMVAQSDLLICDFASSYYLGDEMNSVPLTSCKMRQLAKFVVELRSRNPQFQNLIDILKPTNYDLIVAAIWKLAKFDWDKNRFNAPNFAISVGASLKRCCQIAMQNPLKYDSSANISVQDLKDLLHEFETKWKQDVWDAALRSFSGTKNETHTNSNLIKDSTTLQPNNGSNMSLMTPQTPRRRQYTPREPWTNEQKNVIIEYFHNHISQKKSPKSTECRFLKNKYPKLLENKNWQNIKSFVQYKYSYVTKANVVNKND